MTGSLAFDGRRCRDCRRMSCASGRGAAGAKGPGRGQCGAATHTPGTRMGKGVTGAGSPPESCEGKEAGEAHRAPPPSRYRDAAVYPDAPMLPLLKRHGGVQKHFQITDVTAAAQSEIRRRHDLHYITGMGQAKARASYPSFAPETCRSRSLPNLALCQMATIRPLNPPARSILIDGVLQTERRNALVGELVDGKRRRHAARRRNRHSASRSVVVINRRPCS
jgi:hypothetical protein